MLHRDKLYIVGDRVLINKQQGIIKYIGELTSSNKIWIGVHLDSKKTNMKKKLFQQESNPIHQQKLPLKTKNENNKYEGTDGSIDNIVYIENKKKTKDIIFIEAIKITKWLRGINNKHLSRKFEINQEVWIKSIKCKGIIKSMFYEAPKYILKQINKTTKSGKQYIAILLDKPFGNNRRNKIKYFQCDDDYDYFVKIDRKQVIPSNEYNERLSSYNLELLIDHWFDEYFDSNSIQLPQELISLLISFFGAMDGILQLKEYQVHKYQEHCIDLNDYYEYDSVYLAKFSRLLGGKLICIKCFGDIIIDENAEISVNDTVNLTKDELIKLNAQKLKYGAKRNSNGGGKGGGIIKIICFGNVYLRKNALISANGGCGGFVGYGNPLSAGFGGGGTVYIKCTKLTNYGSIFAWGSNITEASWDWGQQTWYWRNSRWQTNGKIVIDAEYTEHGCDAINRSYYGPVLMPPQSGLNHQSKQQMRY